MGWARVKKQDFWYLDYEKRINAFKERGFEVKKEYIDESRKDLLILDACNVNIFLERVEIYKISTEKLRSLLMQNRTDDDDSWVYDFRPSLYVDFDTRKLYSLYSEPASYEEYVPLNWEGKYFDFLELVPREYRYWQNDVLMNLLNKGEE